jgi:hypothetical protein
MTSDLTDVLDDEGRLVNLKDLPEEIRSCISEIRFSDEGVAKSVKFWPKPQALHLAATHLRLLVELSEQKTSLEIRIREMTPDQRRQYVIELLAKARKMLSNKINADEAEYSVVSTNGIAPEESTERSDKGDGAV